MTEKQEIRAKSMELAIGLLGVLTIPKEVSLNVENAKLYVDDIASLAEAFEELILKAARE
jgi:hypothetical protein